MSQLVKNGTVANMKDFLASDESYVKEEDFDEGVWGAARTEDGVWGLSVETVIRWCCIIRRRCLKN